MVHRTSPTVVLLVEDDPEDMRLITDLINAGRGGFDVQAASSANEAHKILASQVVDICIVDYLLGDVDGLDFIAECQQNGVGAAFLLVTGVGTQDIDDRAESLGVDQYLPKQELNIVSIDRALRYARPREPAPAHEAKLSKRKGNLALQMALARDSGVREAALASGISERTAHRRMREPGFMAEVERLRAEIQARMLDIAAQDVLEQPSDDA